MLARKVACLAGFKWFQWFLKTKISKMAIHDLDDLGYPMKKNEDVSRSFRTRWAQVRAGRSNARDILGFRAKAGPLGTSQTSGIPFCTIDYHVYSYHIAIHIIY